MLGALTNNLVRIVGDVANDFLNTPEEFLSGWTPSRATLRNFIETKGLPPQGDAAQRAAAKAALKAASPPPNRDHGAAAFFDIDNTVIRGSSLIEFGLGLAKRRYFKASEVGPMLWKQLKYKFTGSEDADHVEEGRNQALEFIKGRSEAELVALCEEIVENSMQYQTFAGTLQLAQEHLDAGQEVWLVSATPVQLADILARRFGFTGALGTVPEVVDGIFTGRLEGDILHGPGKRHAVKALAKHQEFDLERCTAYSDSINDLPMLTMVGNPVAVNPDAKLKKEAEARGWPIKDYRSVRTAVKKWGIPGLATAALTLAGMRARRRRTK